jgi:hypothetical protein
VFSDPLGKIRKASEDISVSGEQSPLAALDVCQCTKPVDFQFEDKLVGIERLDAAGEPYRT